MNVKLILIENYSISVNYFEKIKWKLIDSKKSEDGDSKIYRIVFCFNFQFVWK